MLTRLAIITSLIAIVGILGCSSERTEPDKNLLGYQYYPLEVGDFRIYDVQEINFSLLEGGDTSNFQLKEVVQDYHQQIEDDTSYYLYRYSRSFDTEDWKLDSVWTARKDVRRVVVTESNVAYIKLVFPFTDGLSWDANGMNADEPELYSVNKTGEAFQKEGENFQSTVTIVERNNMDTVIQERYRESVYALNIGLVYKELRYIDYCATNVECLGLGIIEGGRKYIQLLKEYGKE